MKMKYTAVATGILVGIAWSVVAESTINPDDRYAYAANAGWIDCRADGANGMVVGQAFCSGYAYAANLGWIHLGDGTPANGYAYANDSATDYGVNHDGAGSLRGYAYGANIGWINFEPLGDPHLDLFTGNLSGNAYGANIGWISLSNLYAHVRTDTLDPGPDTDDDDIPDPWEYGHTNVLEVLGPWDSDGDGVDDDAEYGADTDPFDINDFLRVTALTLGASDDTVTWSSKPTRFYLIQASSLLPDPLSWTDSGLGAQVPATGGETTKSVPVSPGLPKFYRIEAIRPPLP